MGTDADARRRRGRKSRSALERENVSARKRSERSEQWNESTRRRKQVERNEDETKRTNGRKCNEREKETKTSTHPARTQTPKRRRRRRCRLAAMNNGQTNERTANKEYARTSSLSTLHPLVSSSFAFPSSSPHPSPTRPRSSPTRRPSPTRRSSPTRPRPSSFVLRPASCVCVCVCGGASSRLELAGSCCCLDSCEVSWMDRESRKGKGEDG